MQKIKFRLPQGTGNANEGHVTGEEWEQYFKEIYGSENVARVKLPYSGSAEATVEGSGNAIKGGSSVDIDATKLNYSNSATHPNRPYQQSSQTIQEIINSGPPKVDPRGSNGFWWDVDGSFNGTPGHYELLINPDKTTIWHYLFKGY